MADKKRPAEEAPQGTGGEKVIEAGEEAPPIGTKAALGVARDKITEFLAGKDTTAGWVRFGSATLLRVGTQRLVSYLEMDGVRIEVYKL